MSLPWAEVDHVDATPASYLAEVGEVFAVFDQQDSGNVSYGVLVDGARYFAKTAGDPQGNHHLDHGARTALLHNAAQLARDVRHPALATFEALVPTSQGPMLVYRWAEGELVGAHRGHRDDPAGAFQRFRALPVAEIETVLDTLYDLHDHLTALGWVAEDLYDGCLIYDFASRRLTVMDLDTYHRGPFTNDRGRLFGSDRFMAPEEFVLGARIDQRTTVFTLARIAQVLLSAGADGTYDEATFRGSPARLAVLDRATAPDPDHRFATVSEFVAAWR